LTSKFPDKPFKRSYATIPGGVWGGAYPGDKDPTIMKEQLQGLIDCGISKVFNLTEEGELDHNDDFLVPYDTMFKDMWNTYPQTARRFTEDSTHLPVPHMGVVDMHVPYPGTAPMRIYLDYLHAYASRGPVFIHSREGKGRTGLILGCYLVELGIVTGEEAITYLNRVRRLYGDPNADDLVPQTQEQRNMILSWHIVCRGGMDAMYKERKKELPFDWDASVKFIRKVVEMDDSKFERKVLRISSGASGRRLSRCSD
jgi:protein-tyrosine phosphatase